jgi:fructokinase
MAGLVVPGPTRTVVAWGELLWDLFPEGPRLGGAAANVAYHAARLGARSVLVSRVGHDELGTRALAWLSAAGVDTRHVSVDPERPTGTVQVDLSRGEPRFTIGEQVAWDRIPWSPELSQDIRRAEVVVFGTLAQRTPLAAGALGQALRHTVPSAWCVCDLNLRPPFVTRPVVADSLGRAHVIKLNQEEAQHVGELFDTSDPVAWLLKQGQVRLVALTLGAEGALLATTDERAEISGVPLAGLSGDPVGAGDSFTAALAVLVGRGLPWVTVASAANRYASFVAGSPGAMPLVPEEILEELRELLRVT